MRHSADKFCTIIAVSVKIAYTGHSTDRFCTVVAVPAMLAYMGHSAARNTEYKQQRCNYIYTTK